MTFDAQQDAYIALKKVIAERTSPVIAWVGAGLSAPAGLPSWAGLLDELIAVVRRKHASLSLSPRSKGLEAHLLEERRLQNYWLCFQLLEELLGTTSYQAEIRDRLNAASHSSIPPGYAALWKAGVQGIVTFNLDQFASRSYSLAFPGQAVDQFIGAQSKNMLGVLQRPRPFIGNVHGSIDNAASWIFTHDKLTELLKDPGYLQFVNTCLLARTVLFVGVSADDVAVRTHLDIVRMTGATGISHYWITSRTDEDTDRWAEEYRIRVVRYENKSKTHAELIECLKDLAAAGPSVDVPVLAPVLPNALARAASQPLDDPEVLVGRPLEVIRQELNARALALLEVPSASAYKAYEEFSEQYDEAIDRAWYVTATPPKNVLLGYTLDRRVATGSFGEVFDARDANGTRVALKLLRRDVRRDPAMLQTFRRGVRSMKILKARGVKGMIDFVDASEIPAIVVMEWIDGPNLMEAVQKKALPSWDMILDVALGLARIIHAAHLLPEGVLHRDIRPPNIMLRDFWTNGQIVDVMVMDFDLSWHIDALENTVLAKPLGFMAPEQLHQKGGLTRSALVDSFGFGMTLYFVLTGEIPVPDQQRHKDWDQTLKNKVQSRRSGTWKSLPTRVARLIEGATKDAQKERWDFSRILSEIETLHALNAGDLVDTPSDYFCDEIASFSGCMEGYEWDDSRSAATYKSLGLVIELTAHLPEDEVRLTIEWRQTGSENWKLVPKTTAQVIEKVRPTLERGGWTAAKFEGSSGYMRVTASFSTDAPKFHPSQLAAGIDALVGSMLPKA
jgi:serine/threonine protein kinase